MLPEKQLLYREKRKACSLANCSVQSEQQIRTVTYHPAFFLARQFCRPLSERAQHFTYNIMRARALLLSPPVIGHTFLSLVHLSKLLLLLLLLLLLRSKHAVITYKASNPLFPYSILCTKLVNSEPDICFLEGFPNITWTPSLSRVCVRECALVHIPTHKHKI